jgi:uncharacterized membrane protein YraQ (UPF0718 family)
MNLRNEWKPLLLIAGGFALVFFLPLGYPRFDKAIMEGLYLAKEYAQLHVILCLLPAFFIAGAIGVFISKEAVMKYLGPTANKVLAYGVSAVSGTVLTVCSCTILPMFAGIYKMGAGIGPATTFLYSGPAISVLAIILTAKVLGLRMGIARAVGAIGFSVVIGLVMHLIFRKEEELKVKIAQADQTLYEPTRPLCKNVLFFFILVAIMVTGTWGGCDCSGSLTPAKYFVKDIILIILSISLGAILIFWFRAKWWKVALTAVAVALCVVLFPDRMLLFYIVGTVGLSYITTTTKGEASEWFDSTLFFLKQILPILLIGVVISGILLGRPGQEGIIPSKWVTIAVGGNSLRANFFAAIFGAFMYFSTLMEVPIIQGLIGNGMGQGPALTMLLADPALSLPSMLVLNSIMGPKKTIAYCLLVVFGATITGYLYGVLIV